eukprot:9602391-Lingulodinium_polyedra.AAC.1
MPRAHRGAQLAAVAGHHVAAARSPVLRRRRPGGRGPLLPPLRPLHPGALGAQRGLRLHSRGRAG